jgi:non-specific protein-tyrosine kinase
MSKVNLITLTDPRAPAAEAYRTLRTNLMFASTDKPVTAFVISAASQPDDKSSAAANLAVTFAQAGNKTILVDADMRRPQQHDIWGLDNTRGLSSLMTDDSLLATPPLQATDVANLSVLTAGALPANPADLLSGARMGEVLGLLRARASYVIFDAPPVLAVTDAALLGAKTDGLLLVVRAGQTRREHTLRARQALERVHVRILGAVLTNARQESGGY